MISAFGVEHGEISKAWNDRKKSALENAATTEGRKGDYARSRLALKNGPREYRTHNKIEGRLATDSKPNYTKKFATQRRRETVEATIADKKGALISTDEAVRRARLARVGMWRR